MIDPVDERNTDCYYFLQAAQLNPAFADYEQIGDRHVYRFKGFWNVSVVWNEGFTRWETQTSSMINETLRITIEVKGVTAIVELLMNGFNKYCTEQLQNS